MSIIQDSGPNNFDMTVSVELLRQVQLYSLLYSFLFKITGQGTDECFISQRQAILYSFVLPVALVMLFNLYALGHIVIHIVKTRKVSKINYYLRTFFYFITDVLRCHQSCEEKIFRSLPLADRLPT